VYLKLSDPTYLRTLSDAQLYGLRTQLSQSDYQHFTNERAKLLNPTGSAAPGDLNSPAIKTTLDARLRELKIDPTPKDDGGNDAARVGAIRRYVDEQVLMAQRGQGKKFDDAQTSAFIDKLFTQSAQLKGWISSYSAPLLSTKPGDIPSADRDAIKTAFKKQGVDDPTDAQILNAFLHAKTKR
jgi:soluble lytic murein transglycosylase